MSAYSGGNLLGYIVAGALPRPSGRAFSIFTIALLFTFGSVLASLGWVTSTALDVALMLFLGIGNGYIGLVMFTWIQQRTPKDMLGRVMSIIMLSNFGLAPLSQTLSGGLARWNLTALFGLFGGATLLVTLWAAFHPALKVLSDDMVGDKTTE
jgi:MFS family permease